MTELQSLKGTSKNGTCSDRIPFSLEIQRHSIGTSPVLRGSLKLRVVALPLFYFSLILVVPNVLAEQKSSVEERSDRQSETDLAVKRAIGEVRKLRENRKFKEALKSLQALEENGISEVKALVPFERAKTLIMSARSQKSSQARQAELEKAIENFQLFIKRQPKSSRVGEAHDAMGQIYLRWAHSGLWSAKAEEKVERDAELKKLRVAILAPAVHHFTEARNRSLEAFKKFPAFIPREKKEQYLARRKAEQNYIQSELSLAECGFLTAHTFDRQSNEFRNAIKKAEQQFERLHTRYRTQAAGLYARLWHGRCLKARGAIRSALGIFNELRAYPSNSEVLKSVRDQALHFRLACLNHDQRKDFQLVVEEASKWLDSQEQDKRRQRTPVGLGIRFQRAHAANFLVNDQAAELSDQRRKQLRIIVREDAAFVSRFPGEYQHSAQQLVDRLRTALKVDSKALAATQGSGVDFLKRIRGFHSGLAATAKVDAAHADIESMACRQSERTGEHS